MYPIELVDPLIMDRLALLIPIAALLVFISTMDSSRFVSCLKHMMCNRKNENSIHTKYDCRLVLCSL
ncbi:hypothetical protein M758_10G158000 [Ceratodon purpureus]|nr:hypothetical protein M758_10G158000 [Ceratodon purpureus]